MASDTGGRCCWPLPHKVGKRFMRRCEVVTLAVRATKNHGWPLV